MYVAQAPCGAVPVAAAGVDTSTPYLLSVEGAYMPGRPHAAMALLVLLALALGYSGLALLYAIALLMDVASGYGDAVTGFRIFKEGLVITKRQGAFGGDYEAYEVQWAKVKALRLKRSHLVIIQDDERLQSSVGRRVLFIPSAQEVPKLAADLRALVDAGGIPATVETDVAEDDKKQSQAGRRNPQAATPPPAVLP